MTKDLHVRCIENIILTLAAIILATTTGTLLFISLSEENQDRAIQQLANELTAASAKNHAFAINNQPGARIVVPIEISNCQHANALLPSQSLPDRYQIQSKHIAKGHSTDCTLRFQQHQASFKATGV